MAYKYISAQHFKRDVYKRQVLGLAGAAFLAFFTTTGFAGSATGADGGGFDSFIFSSKAARALAWASLSSTVAAGGGGVATGSAILGVSVFTTGFFALTGFTGAIVSSAAAGAPAWIGLTVGGGATQG